jgi:hypothetical protein
VQAYFYKEGYFGHEPIFGEKDLFWERPNFGACTINGKKVACRKRRKSRMQEEKQRGAQAGKHNHNRVRVFYKDCKVYKPIK